MEASLSHGLENGLSRWPNEIDTLVRLGRENFTAIRNTLGGRGIDAAWDETGVISVATREHEVEWLAEAAVVGREHGEESLLLDREAVRAEVSSPTYLAGLWHRSGNATVDPARLAWGLREAALGEGVRIHEHTRVTKLRRDGDGVVLETEPAVAGAKAGKLRARRVLLATNAYPPLVRSIRRYMVPVYDYVLVTEPLSEEQRQAIGWERRQGIADSGNRFHYYRLTEDDRILWGGYEALYHFRNGMRTELEDHAPTFELLARNFAETFPQLEGLRFTHRWAGAIDTSSRFCGLSDARWADARRTPSATPAWAWPPPALALASRSTSCTTDTPSSPGSSWSAAGRSRFRRSRFATPLSRPPGGRWPAPTSAAAGAAPGSADLTG